MVAKRDSTTDHYSLTIEAPAEVDAGAEFTLRCQVVCPPGRDPGGLAVSVRDSGDAELAFAGLAQLDGEVWVTDEIPLTAPLAEGEFICRAVLVPDEGDDPADDIIATGFSVVVKAHGMRLNVWDLPPAIVAGEGFTLKAGIKCSAGCDLAGRELTIVDATGARIGTGRLRDEVWPGSSALYFAEVEGKAPSSVGPHKWEVRIAASASGLPHAAGTLAFDVKIVDPPDCEVTIEAFDAAQQTPLRGARIVLQPYRAVADENGVATLKVVKGSYKLLVSASRYIATNRIVEVTGDATVRAELTLEPIVDPISYYT